MDKKLLDYMNQVARYYTQSSSYTGQEVANMLLGINLKKETNHHYETSQPSLSTQSSWGASDTVYNMDMDELEKWRNKNNSKFTIRASLPITSHRKIIGKFIVFGKKVVRYCLKWYIDPIVEQQNEFNGSVTASINAVYNNNLVENQFMQECSSKMQMQQMYLQEHAEELKGAFEQIQALANELNAMKQELKDREEVEQTLRREIKELKEVLMEQVDEEVKELQEQLSRTSEEVEVRRSEIVQVGQKIQELIENDAKLNQDIQVVDVKLHEELQRQAANTQQQIETTQENIHYLTYKFNKAKKEGIKVQLEEMKPVIEGKGLRVKDNIELDYFLFENKFRGTEKAIKKNQVHYLEYYKDKTNVLDIGCGRGEFLELLTENNIPATGIDVYDEFVEYCVDKGLNAKEDDALSYVRGLDTNSIDGIFMSQVAEHLENDYLLNLLAESYTKLQKGSYFIAETPNPTNLSTFTNNFYLDPSHVKPVHPATFKFMLEYVGFKDVEIVYTESSKPGYRLPLLEVNGGANLAEFNSGINCVTDMLFGSLDYAVIARK